MKKIILTLTVLLLCPVVWSQGLSGAWHGSYIVNANVFKFNAYFNNQNPSELLVDVIDSEIFDLKYDLTANSDSVTFSRINSQGTLVEFKGVRSNNKVTGSLFIHNEYMKDKPGLFQLMKSDAALVKNQFIEPFELTTMAGQKISEKQFTGKYYMLDFWATWCPPCVAKRPKLEEIKAKLGDEFEIVSISLDSDAPTVESFRKEKFDMPWYHVLKSGKFKDPFIKTYVPTGLPYGYIINPQGKVIAYGKELDADNILNTIERVIQ